MSEFIKTLCEKIKLEKGIIALIIPFFESGEAYRLADKICEKGAGFCHTEYRKNPQKYALLLLSASLILAERVYEKYREKNIPDGIYYDTMTDIAIWAKTLKREENIDGIKNIGWIYNILSFKMFKIGRIQYQLYKSNFTVSRVPIFKRHSLTVKNHKSVLNMHIPEGEPLELEKCRESVQRAKEFFVTYFPEYRYDGFVCDSWLLDPNNQLFMNENGNIRKFCELFDITVRTKINHFDIVRRLWGKRIIRRSEVKDFPENTDLQKRTKKYLLDGGKTGSGYGTIKL